MLGFLHKNKAHILKKNTRHPKSMKMDFNRNVIISCEDTFVNIYFQGNSAQSRYSTYEHP